MSIQNPADTARLWGKEIVPESRWWLDILKGLGKSELVQINTLRGIFATQGVAQRWRYEGAGRDLLPVVLAPPGTKFNYVDTTYRFDGIAHKDTVGPDLINPLLNAGAKVSIDMDWATAYIKGNQELRISDGTKINLKGSKLEDEELIVGSPDVIFTNPYSPLGGESLIKLKEGGMLAYEGSESLREPSIYIFPEYKLSQMGLELQYFNFIHSLDIPLISQVQGIGKNKHSKYVSVYRKTRDLSLRERDVLRINTVTWDVSTVINQLIEANGGRFIRNTNLLGIEDELRKSLDRYFRTLSSCSQDGVDLARRARNVLEQKYIRRDILPKSVTIPTRHHPKLIEQYYEGLRKAQSMYWEAKWK